ncbi:complex I NDUFA9 subunit family protein [Enterovirga sp. DB1703]|uniref:Complex I NDUFA9 subunit family protein n=2 Tax=Enterovirga aerilata TaxID=2730920 RepID=A0A849I3C3_9HYPH|nr:complex I NDUFA9 subunit family protein [Enterovirga sp. DB1703]
MDAMRQSPKLVTVFGGSGFLGRHVVRALAKRGYRVRVAVRRPDLGFFLQPLGVVGQIQLVQANLRYPDTVRRALDRADAVVNCVGILSESGRQSFGPVQAEGARVIAEGTPAGLPLVQVSAIGADPNSASAYARTKGQGDAAVLAARPDAVIVRPSVLFGQGDSFFNRFAALARALPILPIAGAETRFQPVWAGDVGEAIALAVDGRVLGGRIYEFGGPEIRTLRELVEYVLQVTERKRMIIAMPEGLARIQARVMEIVDALSFGLLPDELKLTRDQLVLLRQDNVVSEGARAEARTLEGIGMTPRAMEAIVPAYLTRFRKTGQFDLKRAA